jgi:hypothetical protein
MNRQTKVIAFALATLLLAACFSGMRGPSIRGSGNVKTEPRAASGFNAVELAGIGKLLVEQTGRESLSVEAEDNLLPYLTTEVRGSRLVIGMKPYTNLKPTKPVVFRLSVKGLEAVSLSGSGDIEAGALNSPQFTAGLSGSGNLSLGKVTAAHFALHSSGSGEFKSLGIKSDEVRLDDSGSGDSTIDNLETKNLNVGQTGSGSLRLSGHGDSQEIKVTGPGAYQAENLDSRTVTITLSGSGSADLKVSERLNATLTGSGSVNYSGEAEVQKTISGSGRVNKR